MSAMLQTLPVFRRYTEQSNTRERNCVEDERMRVRISFASAFLLAIALGARHPISRTPAPVALLP